MPSLLSHVWCSGVWCGIVAVEGEGKGRETWHVYMNAIGQHVRPAKSLTREQGKLWGWVRLVR